MDRNNRQIVITELPHGTLTENHFELRTSVRPQAGPGELLTRTLLISTDAANRTWMQGATYRDAIKAGDVMHAYGVARVEESQAEGFAAGDLVFGEVRWQDYSIMKAADTGKLPPGISGELMLWGFAAQTSYVGLVEVGQIMAGETVVISGAAGSIGVTSGQIAKALGARVIGIAGGPEKCAWLINDVGYDAAIDYKADDFRRTLKAAVPDGIDLFFDNVGGEILTTVLFNMKMHGRIVCCGVVSQYDTAAPQGTLGLPGLLITKRLRMEGFIVLDYADKQPEIMARLLGWLQDGKLQPITDIFDGLENAPAALINLLAGGNRGKRMVRVAPD